MTILVKNTVINVERFISAKDLVKIIHEKIVKKA